MSWKSPTNVPLNDRLAGLTAFLPIFESPGFSSGKWAGGEKEGDAITMPWFSFSDAASRFIDAAYRLAWVVSDFDWIAWAHGEEAQRLLNNPMALASADVDEITKLLTAHIRQDRYCEGHLAGMFESGHITAILRRLKAIEMESCE